jgi:hypothetical protein
MIKKSVLESGVFDSFNAPKMAISLIMRRCFLER